MQINNNNISKMIAKRRWVRRLNLFRLPDKVFASHKGKKIFLSTNDWKGPSYHVLNWGIETYEKNNIDFLKKYLQSIDKPVFFDVGANVGIFSFMLATEMKDLRVFAFEPEKISYSCLSTTFTQSQFPFVRVLNNAVSDKKEKLMLYSDDQNHGGHSLYQEMIKEEKNNISNEYYVNTVSLDLFLHENAIDKVDVVKMDIQGHEGVALKGSQKLIDDHRPLFLMECYMKGLLSDDSELLKPFLNKNYGIIVPETGERVSLNKESLSALFKNQEAYIDLAFVPEEKMQIFLN